MVTYDYKTQQCRFFHEALWDSWKNLYFTKSKENDPKLHMNVSSKL